MLRARLYKHELELHNSEKKQNRTEQRRDYLGAANPLLCAWTNHALKICVAATNRAIRALSWTAIWKDLSALIYCIKTTHKRFY